MGERAGNIGVPETGAADSGRAGFAGRILWTAPAASERPPAGRPGDGHFRLRQLRGMDLPRRERPDARGRCGSLREARSSPRDLSRFRNAGAPKSRVLREGLTSAVPRSPSGEPRPAHPPSRVWSHEVDTVTPRGAVAAKRVTGPGPGRPSWHSNHDRVRVALPLPICGRWAR